MKFNEFRLWFEGFSYSIKGRPTVEQWELIVQKLDTVYPNDDFNLPIEREFGHEISRQPENYQPASLSSVPNAPELQPEIVNCNSVDSNDGVKTACL